MSPSARSIRTEARRTRGWAVELTIVAVACAAPVVWERVRGMVRAGDDLGVLFLPNFAWWWAAPRWLGGWHPWIFGGFPANADPQFSSLHPLGALYAVLAPTDAAAVEAILGPTLAAAGMLAYLRTIGVGAIGRVVGALAFALGGFMAAQAPHPPQLRSVIALPWALAAIEALEGRALVAGLGAAVGAILIGGHPQVMAYALALVVGYAVWLGRPQGGRAWALLAALALGVALSAAAWLPALHLLRVSTRAAGTFALVDPDRPGLGELVRLVVPFAGGGATRGLYGAGLPGRADGLLAYGAYPGLLVWIASVAGVPTLVRDRRGRFWLAAGVLGLLLGAGVLPAGRGVRAVGRFWLWSNLGAAAAGAIALDAGEGPARRPRAWWIAGVVVALAVAAAAVGGPVARRAALGSALVLGATLVSAAVTGRGGSPWWLVAIAAADMVVFTASMPVAITREAYAATRVRVAALRDVPGEPRDGRALALPLLPGANWAPFAGVRLLQGYGALVPSRFAALLGQTGRAGFVELGAVTDASLVAPSSRVLDLLRCRVVASVPEKSPLADAIDARAAAGDARWTRLDPPPASPFRFHRNRRALPVAWLVRRVRVVPDDAALALVRGERTGDGFDPAAEALVAAPVAGLDEGTGDAGEVIVAEYADDELRLAVRAATAALLVTSELAYPGWEATVDGERRPMLTANAAFRAVAVPAGAHDVRFAYRPRDARIGLFVGAGALVALVALAVSAVGRRS